MRPIKYSHILSTNINFKKVGNICLKKLKELGKKYNYKRIYRLMKEELKISSRIKRRENTLKIPQTIRLRIY